MAYVHIYVLYILILGGIILSKLPYIHYHKDKNDLIRTYFLALIPLLLFGFYKNGIRLYGNQLISFVDMFIPLYFYLISLIVGYIVALIRGEDKKEFMLYSLILACSISMNSNVFIYPVILFAGLFVASYIKDKFRFNFVSLTRLFLILALLLSQYSYMNVAEKLDAFHYNLFDLFFGYSIGGIASSSLFFVILAFILLLFNRFYKKNISIVASLSFALILFLAFFITKDISYVEKVLSGSVYFAFVFVGADLAVSPNTNLGMILYGLVIGVFTALLALFLPIYEVPFISIFLVSLSIPLINKICDKKYLQ